MKENNIEFRHMQRGKQKAALNKGDLLQIKNIEKSGSCNKKALLMLHGFTSSPAVFRLLVPKLEHYETIACPALPGHTGYLKDLEAATAQNWINATEEICASLLSQYAQLDVLGVSMGGLLACHLSKKYPINHLYLLAPAFDLHLPINIILNILGFLKVLGFKTLRGDGGNILNKAETEISVRRIPINSILEILNLIKSFHIDSINCPVDLFLGSHDEVVNSRKVADRLNRLCNQLKIHWLSQSAHILPLDLDMHMIAECINHNSADQSKILKS